jgi:hypothetical protein
LREPRVAHELRERVRQYVQLGSNQAKFGASPQGAKDIEGRQVEMQRRVLRGPIAGIDAEMCTRPPEENESRPMADHHAFGSP